ALIDQADQDELDAKDESQFTPMHWAAMYGQLGSVKLLCEAGASTSEQNDN
ncbi:unnamed protein product, partial [Heterosigma akashiwo]